MNNDRLIATYFYKNEEKKIEVFYDDWPCSPYEDTGYCEGHLAIWGKNTLGLPTEKNHKKYFNLEGYRGISKVIEDAFDSNDVVLPVYLYDHSGITIQTTPFTCSWDSGKIGFVYMCHEDIIKEFGVNTEETRAKAKERMESYIRLLDDYVQGSCYYVKEYWKEQYINVRTQETKDFWEADEGVSDFIGNIEDNLKCMIEDFDSSRLKYI